MSKNCISGYLEKAREKFECIENLMEDNMPRRADSMLTELEFDWFHEDAMRDPWYSEKFNALYNKIHKRRANGYIRRREFSSLYPDPDKLGVGGHKKSVTY